MNFFVVIQDLDAHNHSLFATKAVSVVDMVRKLRIQDLDVELEYLIFFLHLGK